MKKLAGQVALVTGGTGLLGGAVIHRLAQEGATVVLASRDLQKAQAWIETQTGIAGGSLVPAQLDLADAGSIRRAFSRMRSEVGPPTILIAGASSREALAEDDPEAIHGSFTQLFAVDVVGHYLCGNLLVEGLAEGTPASIVLLSSIYAIAGVDQAIYPPGMKATPAAYAAVKAAVIGLTKYLAALWGDRNIRVNAIVSGGIRSSARQSDDFVRAYSHKTMLGRMAEPEEIANAAVFLSTRDSSYITGECLVVDGGFSAW